MKQPEIFLSQPLKYATSKAQDGHMSFGHTDESKTKENIIKFVDSLNWGYRALSFIRIAYGNLKTYDVIEAVDNESAPTSSVSIDNSHKADALITSKPGLVLLLPTADCYPVTLYDPKNKLLGLAHLGWHSTDAHLLEKLMGELTKSFNSDPKDILVHFGPGIPKQYYVFEEPIQLRIPSWKPFLTKVDDGYQIDLLGYNLQQLKLAGVKDSNIEIDTRNVVEDPSLESHYMHKKHNQPTARRFLTAVMINTI